MDQLKTEAGQKSAKLPTEVAAHPTYINEFNSWLEFRLTNTSSSAWNETFGDLTRAYYDKGKEGLDRELGKMCSLFVMRKAVSPSNRRHQKQLADLRFPVEWYPEARTIQRTIHLHVGPTNSGKTYQALKRLETAKCGVYAGPLRLLAHEVYSRLNDNGKPCNLLTGDDQRIEGALDQRITSCTVEMVPLGVSFDVAVIDEIQMMENQARGWAWTRALLGLKAKELHLCGEARSVPLLRKLADAMGDQLEIHEYQRLSPLKAMDHSLNHDLKKLQKGDCLVLFSRQAIHAALREVQTETGLRCAMVYGGLPPQIRAEQARLFNDPNSGYDILIASDAVGMGLNLSIKRIVFSTTTKTLGPVILPLTVSEIKQIAGRAGRYRVAGQQEKDGQFNSSDAVPSIPPAPPSVGLVTTLSDQHLPIVRHALSAEAPPITTAGLLPSDEVMHRFAAYFPPDTPFSIVLQRIAELSQCHSQFRLCDLSDQMGIADAIQEVKGLSITDRIVFCAAPVNLRQEMAEAILQELAQAVAKQQVLTLPDIEHLELEVLDQDESLNRFYLKKLEGLHSGLVLYLWLSYRYESIFTSRSLAFQVKGMVETRINNMLTRMAVQRISGLRKPFLQRTPTFVQGAPTALRAAAGF
ncbi:MAG: hypothetical protein M1823_001921 [Watsoniomyces obsoletus]|nr:MAG: hypothetical protein M1823_001921 [Watsoniomyces obsoletus]